MQNAPVQGTRGVSGRNAKRRNPYLDLLRGSPDNAFRTFNCTSGRNPRITVTNGLG